MFGRHPPGLSHLGPKLLLALIALLVMGLWALVAWLLG